MCIGHKGRHDLGSMHVMNTVLLVATMLFGNAVFAQPMQSGGVKPVIRDSAATTLNWFAKNVTLAGTLEVGYRILPQPVLIHGAPEKRQRYIYLHLDRPIDLMDPQAYYKSIFHQYDIQVIPDNLNPETLNKLIGKRVVIKGQFADPGYDSGSPDWEPFPSTIFVSAAVAAVKLAR